MSFASNAGYPKQQETGVVVPTPTLGVETPDHVLSRQRSYRAAQKISALGEMTGGIAHDFRNVLSVIRSGVNVLERRSGDPAKVDTALAAIREGIERGMNMTSGLLAFAKQQELETGLEDVNALLAKLKPFLKYGAGPEIRLVFDVAPGLPKCLVDPPQFNSAILNLVINARDAMPGGGVIRISTSAIAEQAKVTYVRLRVCDNGTGMTQEVMRRVFDPYFTTKGDSGTGLGVPQVHAMMRQLGGLVTVDSLVGKGTSFDLLFPVREARPPVAADVLELDRWANEGGAIAMPTWGRERAREVRTH